MARELHGALPILSFLLMSWIAWFQLASCAEHRDLHRPVNVKPEMDCTIKELAYYYAIKVLFPRCQVLANV